MPTIRCGFENRPDHLVQNGPTALVQIGYDPRSWLDTNRRPDLPAPRLTALLDTGAIASCIDDALAIDLGLPVVERQNVSGVHGIGSVARYRAQMHLPDLDSTFVGVFFGAYLKDGGQPYSAIIGRDFLRHFRLTYDGRTGAVTLSND